MVAYQGRVLAFIGNRRATKEPMPTCLPTTKTWEWFTGDGLNDAEKFNSFYSNIANQGKLWTPEGTGGTAEEMKVPNLLAVLNALVKLLRPLGASITPHDILTTVDTIIEDKTLIGQGGAQAWDRMRRWCLVTGQAGTNGKSKVFLETTSVTIDNKNFDHWVSNKMDITLGPRQQGCPMVYAAAAANLS
jgi:hypothetical protein